MLKRYENLDIDDRIIRNLWDISHTMRHISEGKGSQKRILMILNESGVITQSELTQRIGIQPGSASEVLGKLETAGLITRIPSQSDKRTTDIQLTEEGKLAALEARSQRQERHKRMFARLLEEEKNTLLSLLEKVNEDWEKQYRENGAD